MTPEFWSAVIVIAFIVLWTERSTIARWFRRCRGRRIPRIVFEFDPPTRKEFDMPRSTRFTTTQQQNVRAKFLDSTSREVPVDGIPVWSSSDETIATIVPAADGKSAIVRSGAPGIATITVRADARLGSDTVEISNTFDVEIVNDEAVAIDFEFDAPTDKD